MYNRKIILSNCTYMRSWQLEYIKWSLWMAKCILQWLYIQHKDVKLDELVIQILTRFVISLYYVYKGHI